MNKMRIFLSYVSADAAFAKQLTTDLRTAGAEIVTDNPDLEDTALEQFLSEELPRCQQFLVLQTPEALRSSRMRTVLEAALKSLQKGLITGVLRLVARPLDSMQAEPLPSLWASIPALDAGQDYPRALARLRSHLGLKDDNQLFVAPPPTVPYEPSPSSSKVKGVRKEFLMTYSSFNQGFKAKDRPVRAFRSPFAPLRSRFILFSLALLLVLVLAGGAVFLSQSFVSVKPPSTVPPTPATLTPLQLYDAVMGRPTLYSSDLSQQDRANWDQEGRCQFAGGTYQVFMPASPRGLDFQGCLEKTFRLSDFAFQAQMTINSGTKGEGGGLIFRAQDAFNSYRLRVNLDGSYDLTRMATTSLFGTSSAIKTGFNQPNLLTVIAQGPRIFLYVNKQFLGEVNNALPNEGQFGFMTVSVSQDTRISWTDVQVWKM